MNPLAVVVPTNRPESLSHFLSEWDDHFRRHGSVEVFVVHDHAGTWKGMPDFIPSRTGAIRSYGLLQAWREGCDVVTLDDDCLPARDVDLIGAYLDAADRTWPVSDYFDVGHAFGLGEFMRGYPFGDRYVDTPLVQYGGWDNVPDFDAVTQLSRETRDEPTEDFRFRRDVLAVPRGLAITGCIMNAWIVHEAIPMMYQMMMGVERVGYDRFDDMWSGLFAKRICDHLRRPILINGNASITHTRASDPESNYEKERSGYDLHERMWRNLDAVVLTEHTVLNCYEELVEQVRPDWFGPRGDTIVTGMHGWLAALRSV